MFGPALHYHMGMKTLTAKHLAKSYKRRPVVKDVSLSISSNQIVGLIGPNGAGKTTCFYMIIGIVPLDRGTIQIDDDDITHLPMHGRAKKGIGYLPQEASVFRKLSVEDNVMAILETRKELSKGERRDKRDELLTEFSITHIRNKLGMELSGGERRRVEIARALASDPAFILLDEPFAGVDPRSVSEIKNIISQLKERGLGVLITDHNVRETLDICEKGFVVGHGNIIFSGAPHEILQSQLVKDLYLGDEFETTHKITH